MDARNTTSDAWLGWQFYLNKNKIINLNLKEHCNYRFEIGNWPGAFYRSITVTCFDFFEGLVGKIKSGYDVLWNFLQVEP